MSYDLQAPQTVHRSQTEKSTTKTVTVGLTWGGSNWPDYSQLAVYAASIPLVVSLGLSGSQSCKDLGCLKRLWLKGGRYPAYSKRGVGLIASLP